MSDLDELCIHELLPETCSICLDGPNEEERPFVIRGPIRARYDGHCNACNLPIYIEQLIVKLSNGMVVHWGCER